MAGVTFPAYVLKCFFCDYFPDLDNAIIVLAFPVGHIGVTIDANSSFFSRHGIASLSLH